MDFCFTTDDMTFNFELFSKIKINALYITESMRTYWLYILDEYWEEKDTPYSEDFYFRPEWLFKYFGELKLCESVESAYLMWKSEQHILTPKYDILSSLMPRVNHYFVTMEEDGNQFKIIFQFCNGFVTCKGKSVKIL